jgi:hypothetical protein
MKNYSNEIQVENKLEYLQNYSPYHKKIKYDSKVLCVHCKEEYLIIDCIIIESFYWEFWKETYIRRERIMCKNYPNCEGGIITWVDLWDEDKKGKF